MRHLRLLALLPLGLAALAASVRAGEHAHGLLLVANKGAHTVSIIDPESGTQVAVVPETGVTAHELAASPDGRLAFVPIYGNSGVGRPGTDGREIDVIDLVAHKVISTIDFGHGVRPHNAVVGPADGLIYVTTELDKTVSIIDPRTLKIVGSIPTGQPESHMLAISHDGKRGYTSNVGPGTVSVLDMESRKTVATIHISPVAQRISISPDDRLVFTADQTKPQLAIIDTASSSIKGWVPLPGRGYGTASSPDGKWLVVAVPDERKVAVVDVAQQKVVQAIDVPASPQEILMRPDGQVAYASCDSSHKVAAIRTSDWKVDKLIDTGAGADGLAWATAK
ncbi:MAG: beta-propeller fold lactonase family protein [Acidobacteria bacterium]|nr:beta-propeller fold lactonase family protein [Acidobacteriota bacterium]